MVKYGQIGSDQTSTHKQRVQPTALKDFTMAVPKFGQAVNCHFDMSSPFYVPKISLQYIFIYHCILLKHSLTKIQLIHTNLGLCNISATQRDPVCKKSEPSLLQTDDALGGHRNSAHTLRKPQHPVRATSCFDDIQHIICFDTCSVHSRCS